MLLTCEMSNVSLRLYAPEDRTWIVAQHQVLYREHEGFDDTFGPLVDRLLVQFENDFDPICEAGWIAQEGDQSLGSIFCVKLDEKNRKVAYVFTCSRGARKRCWSTIAGAMHVICEGQRVRRHVPLDS